MIFENVNEAQTIENIKSMLNDYKLYCQLSQAQVPTLQSPSISDMPKGTPYGNSQERKVIDYIMRKQFAKFYCIVVNKTLRAMTDDDEHLIIEECYIKDRYSNSYIMDKIGLADTRYYEVKHHALLTFAMLCPGLPTIDDNGQWIYQEIIEYLNPTEK